MKRIILLLCLLLARDARADHPVWQPGRTWVFAVGVLEFDDPAVASYPDEGRVDAEMIAALRKRGVPQDQILFIKNKEATRENIVSRFAPFLQRAGKDDTLFFYYAGHGNRDYSKPGRTCTFLTYDTKAEWTVASVCDTVRQDFHGSQVLYAADCCHSGSLLDEAAGHGARAAVVASAHVSSPSTGNWTFTRCMVDMFEGNPLLDFDGNGEVTFAEASRYVEGEMAFTEGQQAVHGVFGGFPADMVMARSSGRRTAHMGDHVMAQSEGKWSRAEVLDEKGGRFLVTWPGWAHSYDEWLPSKRIHPFKQETLPAGTLVEVEWSGKWYDGRVVKTQNGLHFVHYEGYPECDDEWMGRDRLRERKAARK